MFSGSYTIKIKFNLNVKILIEATKGVNYKIGWVYQTSQQLLN